MYQTAWVKVSLSPQVPLALSRHLLRSTSNLSLMHQGIFCRRTFLRISRKEIKGMAILYQSGIGMNCL